MFQAKMEKYWDFLKQNLANQKQFAKLVLLALYSQEPLLIINWQETNKMLYRRLLTLLESSQDLFLVCDSETEGKDLFKKAMPNMAPTLKLDSAQTIFLENLFSTKEKVQNLVASFLEVKAKATNYKLLVVAQKQNWENLQNQALTKALTLKFKTNTDLNDNDFQNLLSLDLKTLFQSNYEGAKIRFKDLNIVSKLVQTIMIPETTKAFLSDLHKYLQKVPPYLSQEGIDNISVDQIAWLKMIKVLKVSAVLNDRLNLNLSDLQLCQYAFWQNPSEAKIVKEIIKYLLFKHFKKNSYGPFWAWLKKMELAMQKNDLLSFNLLWKKDKTQQQTLLTFNFSLQKFISQNLSTNFFSDNDFYGWILKEAQAFDLVNKKRLQTVFSYLQKNNFLTYS